MGTVGYSKVAVVDLIHLNFSYGDLNALALRHNMGNVKVCDFSERNRQSPKKLALDVTYEAEDDTIQSPTEVYKPKRRSFKKY